MTCIINSDDNDYISLYSKSSLFKPNTIKSIYVDGNKLEQITLTYECESNTEHTVKYEFVNQNAIPAMFLYDLRDEQPLHIMVPDGIKIIEQYAFGSAIPTSNRILSITLPDSVTTIAQSALSCLTMRYIRLPRNLTEITYSMISYTYYVNELDADFSKVTTIGKEAFYSMSKNVNISRYNKIELPSIQTIESTAFYGCKYYSEIVLGPNCTSIGNNAFQNSSFRIITVHATTPPTLTSNISNAEHIYVPAESVQTYKTTSRWSYYEDIIEAIQ